MGRRINRLQRIQLLRKATDRLCRLYPRAERTHIYHTLVLLEKRPLDRLNLALTRAEKKTLHI